MEPGPDTSIRITALGGLQFFQDGHEPLDLLNRPVLCGLLVYLALERDTTRDSLISIFWPDKSSDRARHSLSQTLYELKTVCGDQWLELEGEVLRATERLTIDAAEFEDAVESESFARAIELYVGELMEGHHLVGTQPFEAWVGRQRSRLARLHRKTQSLWLHALIEDGRKEEALAVARGWVDLDPLEDEAQHALIRLLAEQGSRSRALRQFEEYRQLLAEELQVTPMDETVQLVEHIRGGEIGTSKESPAPATATAERDAGAGPSRAPPAQTAASPSHPGLIHLLLKHSLPVVAALIILLVILEVFVPATEPTPEGAGAALPITRIAVLPFETFVSQSSDLQALANGFTQKLITELNQVEELDLLSWPAVRAYRESTVPLSEIVNILGAGTLVSGRVEEVPPDGHMRVTISLIDGSSQLEMDTEIIEWAAGGLIALGDSIVTEVARFLRERLGQTIQRSERRAGTSVDAAWASVQVGERAMENGARLASTGDTRAARSEFARADSLFHKAETLDDRWLEPVVFRGWLALEQRAALGGSADAAQPDWLEVAGGHAARALDQVPADPQALELRGTVRFRIWETPDLEKPPTLLGDAESDLRAALGSHMAPARALSTLSEVLRRKGDLAEAKRMATRAFDEDPFLTQARTVLEVLAQTSLDLQQDAEAMRWCNEGRERFPDWRYFISCAMTTLAASEKLEPNVDSIWAMAEDLVEASPPTVLRELNRAMAHFLVARLLARAELPDSAGHVLHRALSYVPDHPQSFVLKYHEAGAWLQLGRTEDALRAVELLLERVPERREFYSTDWWFRGLWGDPRFRALVAIPPGATDGGHG